MWVSLLRISNLITQFSTNQQTFRAVDHLSLEMHAGEILGLVGESGCGKSVFANSVMGLQGNSAQVSGEIFFEGQNLIGLSETKFRTYRGKKLSMIFQESSAALSPVFTIGYQLIETLLLHHPGLTRNQAEAKAIALFERVGLPMAEKQLDHYIHELSGGMKQRVAIALAISGKPALLIADEPTTSLDVIIQDQILELLKSLNKEFGMALLLITHDLSVVAETCDRVLVMHQGKIIEQGETFQVFSRPQHEQTKRLVELSQRLTSFLN